MEQQKLPNATISLVLGIISFVACCFSSGMGGLILSGIALHLANKDQKLYLENPDDYYNYSQVKTARTVAIVGLILSAIIALMLIGMLIYFGGFEGYKEYVEEQMELYQNF